MGALYEDVENFFGDIFAWYGRIVSRHPLAFILVPLFTCALLGLGLLKLEYETDLENLYTPISSVASTDRVRLLTLFPDASAHSFYGHQSIAVPAYGEILILALDGPERAQIHPVNYTDNSSYADVLTPVVLDEVESLSNKLYSMTAKVRDRIVQPVRYADVCAMRDGRCVVDGASLIINRTSCITMKDEEALHFHGVLAGVTERVEEHNFGDDPWSQGGEKDDGGGGTKKCLSARALKIRFNLNTNSSSSIVRSIAWQDAFIETLKTYHSDVINVSFVASHSLQIELRDHVGSDTKFLGVSILAMLVLATITGSGINCVGNHITLAYAGVVAALLAILGAFGLLSLIGLRFVNLCSVMPFLVLGIGADDMFQLLAEWRKSDIRESTEDRMASTLRSAAVSITITSLTDLLAFCIGATSPFLSVRNFCACSGSIKACLHYKNIIILMKADAISNFLRIWGDNMTYFLASLVIVVGSFLFIMPPPLHHLSSFN